MQVLSTNMINCTQKSWCDFFNHNPILDSLISLIICQPEKIFILMVVV